MGCDKSSKIQIMAWYRITHKTGKRCHAITLPMMIEFFKSTMLARINRIKGNNFFWVYYRRLETNTCAVNKTNVFFLDLMKHVRIREHLSLRRMKSKCSTIMKIKYNAAQTDIEKNYILC